MAEIMLPRPDNVRGRFGTYVTSDVYHIAERLQEVDPSLYIQHLDPPVVDLHGRENHFAIVEIGPDHVDRLVYRVETLDARIIEHVQYLLRVPFSKRFDAAEKMADKWEAEEKERQLNELYERMGGQMWVDLERCNFITRPLSYAKTNSTARRARGDARLRHYKAAYQGA